MAKVIARTVVMLAAVHVAEIYVESGSLSRNWKKSMVYGLKVRTLGAF